MMLKFLLASSIVCLLISVGVADEEITPLKKFSGKHTDTALLSLRPENGIITEPNALKKVWAAWQPDEPLPKVDFDTQMVLVETAPGPNSVLTSELMLDEHGNLEFVVASTRRTGPGFGYVIMIIPNQGVQSVNGSNVPIGSGTPAEAINIDMTGKIETGIISVGGETTGTVISSNGIVWELDFHGDRNLAQSARVLDATTARVKGTLTRTPGTEVAFRWIVNVASIAPPAFDTAVPFQASEAPRNVNTDRSMKPKEANPINISKIKKGFKSIVVTTSGGPSNNQQLLTIKADGSVTSEILDNDFSTSWTIPPARLEKLHQFINQTDWDQVPKRTRTEEPDAFVYEISIEKPTGLTRLSIDSLSLGERPTIKLLFRFFRK